MLNQQPQILNTVLLVKGGFIAKLSKWRYFAIQGLQF
jgi:hypothetical protein